MMAISIQVNADELRLKCQGANPQKSIELGRPVYDRDMRLEINLENRTVLLNQRLKSRVIRENDRYIAYELDDDPPNTEEVLDRETGDVMSIDREQIRGVYTMRNCVRVRNRL
jgi:hypothetical protein